MATYEDDDEFDFSMLPENQQQEILYGLIGFNETPGDQAVHDMFWNVMYNDNLSYDERQEAYEALQDYLADEYDIMFDEVWDWEDFREWYDSQ